MGENTSTSNLRVLFQDDFLAVVDKPSGFHVHPPEDQTIKVSRSKICLYLLRNQLGKYVYPVHRLDVATSGVLLFALNREAASTLGKSLQDGLFNKIYFAMIRGWMLEPQTVSGPIDDQEARTELAPFSRIEIPKAVGKYPSARYSLVVAKPITGRRHQIRRHLARLSHPILGDAIYGDGAHNRFLKELLKTRQLMLKAHSLEFPHPVTGKKIQVVSRWEGIWHSAFDCFGVCPLGNHSI